MTTMVDLNSPDEGLVGGVTSKRRGKRPKIEQALKVRLEARKLRLNIDRTTWWPNWMDLGSLFRPYRGRWFVTSAVDTNQGWRRNWAIVDSTPLQANNTLAAGMLAGTASPSRPWFVYEFDDEQLMEAEGVKEWLAAVAKKNRDILSQSNYYNCLYECLGEYGVFGIMALGREWPLMRDPTEPDLPHFQPYTIGSYYIGNDKNRRVNVWYRDYRWTVQQVVDKFGVRGPHNEFTPEDDEFWVNISLHVQALYDNNQLDSWIDIVHCVEENIGRQPGKLGWQGMRFRSIYYERGGEPDRILKDSAKNASEEKKLLRVGGFRDFPVWVTRWYTNSEDAWGRGPAMDALGDARALQLQQRRKAQAIDKLVDPPMVADAQLRNQRTSLMAGDTTYIAPEAGGVGFKPAYEVRPDLQGILEDIKETQERINAVMYANIFAMFIDAEKSGQPITAAEVNAKQQEKLLMLGPVLEQMNYDHFNPLHEWLFAEGMRHGMYPPVPPAIQKATLRVKYVSILAQAINAVTASSIDQFTAYVGKVLQIAQGMQQSPAGDKFDADKAIEEYAKATGVPPNIVRSDANVQQIRATRQQQQDAAAKQQAVAQAAQNVNTHAQTMQTLSQTPVGPDGNSALDQLAQSIGAGRVAGK
jgi:hypothetical protein